MNDKQAVLDSLSLEQKVSLLFGNSFWSSTAIGSAGIPSVVLTDGPHGLRRQDGSADHLAMYASRPATCFPPAAAVGSSWNPAIAEQLGTALAREARSMGVDVVLGPGVNIKRSPLCGRNFEYYSEDPLLSGVLGAAYVNAMQADGVGAAVKHFAVNNQETERMRISAEVDERTLREIYLPAFERIVTQARPASIMSSYNKINGVYASENRWLLTDVLRGEWGFSGLVVSDWGAVNNPVASIQAGLDLAMPGPTPANVNKVLEAVRQGELSETQVDQAALRVLDLAGRARLAPLSAFDQDAHHALACELAAECAVLLKNDDAALPLTEGLRIAVIGEFARSPRIQGGGSSHVLPTRVESALDALQVRAAARNCSVDFAPGFTLDDAGDHAKLRDDAVDLARLADVALVFMGLTETEESEGFDRTHLDLPPRQVALLRAINSTKTIVVLSHGAVVSLEGWHDDVAAILDGYLLGQGGGTAIADLLFGIRNPSGRLAETIPLRNEDTPSYINFPGEKGVVRYGEGVMVGYRYYTSTRRPVRYPFGHGLSYTDFHVDQLKVIATGQDTAAVTLEVTNTGQMAGQHVVQIYVATTAGPVRRPLRELRAFRKLALMPGQTTNLLIELDRRAFAYFDVDRADWTVAGGDYTVQVGENASDIVVESTLALDGDRVIIPLTNESSVADWLNHPVIGPIVLDELAADLPPGSLDILNSQPDLMKVIASMPMLKAMLFILSPAAEPTLKRLMKQSLDIYC